MKLVVGLGNPGKEYEKTRHNIGFRVLEEMAGDFKFEKKFPPKADPDRSVGVMLNFKFNKKFNSEIAESKIGKDKIIFVKPQTFMNNSGEAVLAIAKFYKIKPKDIVIAHDEMDLIFGKIKLSFGSRSAGHNGVQSIIDSLGTNEFYRIRVGIGPCPEQISAEKFVLQKFSTTEEKEMKKIISEAIEKIKETI